MDILNANIIPILTSGIDFARGICQLKNPGARKNSVLAHQRSFSDLGT